MKLKLKAAPEDFVVREALQREPGTAGDFAVYRVTKRLLTTMEVQERIAGQLGTAPKALVFPALKDKGAQTTQYFSVRGRSPTQLSGDGYTAHFVGRIPRHLGPADLAGNWFTITVHGLSPAEASALLQGIATVGQQGIPNYFDQQRFGSYGGGVFIGKAILQGDALTALRTYFTESLPGDAATVRPFKRFAAEHWGDWAAMFDQAPQSNYRSILSYLKDHPNGEPGDFRKAINLVTPRLLPLLLEAYQSFLWNRTASRYLARKAGRDGSFTTEDTESTEEEGRSRGVENGIGEVGRRIRAGEGEGPRLATIEVAGEALTVCRGMPLGAVAALSGMSIPLPSHQAVFHDAEVEGIMAEVMAAEGLTLNQMKARILQRAYLPKASRRLVVLPQGMTGHRVDLTSAPSQTLADEGRGASVVVTFFLPPGAYATLVLRVLEAVS